MTVLSINLNKLALLRNSRGRNYPDVVQFALRFISMGVRGITVHPRPDERHIRRSDAVALAAMVHKQPGVEFNIEGYPSEEFLALVEQTRPDQCTLVPDAPGQLTSDHGWDCLRHEKMLKQIIARLHDSGVRVSLFLDPDPKQVSAAAATGTDRIELYTQAYAEAFAAGDFTPVFALYQETAHQAREAGLGINAGHDLDMQNLGQFLQIPGILEVSIGHALIVESIELGMETVVQRYLEICRQAL